MVDGGASTPKNCFRRASSGSHERFMTANAEACSSCQLFGSGVCFRFSALWTVMLRGGCRSTHVQTARYWSLRRFVGDSTAASITPLKPTPPATSAARHTRSNHVNLHPTSTGYRSRRGVIDHRERLSTTFAFFATHFKTMAEPTNPTSPDQILADVPGKWQNAKESGELLFFPSTERIVPGDFPVSVVRGLRAERSDGRGASDGHGGSTACIAPFILVYSGQNQARSRSSSADRPVPDPAVPRARAEADGQCRQGQTEGRRAEDFPVPAAVHSRPVCRESRGR